ncbi:Heat shock protein 60 family co-chaperone GroES [Labilithrix luteola]|uniref:Co-chaperonin GroES n=2 Tax=Labilithrix luteola TaxID=1391654 RepID=A0A0K1PV34_9BACT|nr:Heat shock protein 60 family co-chaperone GroES [Labilithrix luteola]
MLAIDPYTLEGPAFDRLSSRTSRSGASEPEAETGRPGKAFATPQSNSTTGATVMNIRPLQDRVILKRVKEEEKTKGGIIIPDTAKEKPIEGEVVAIGNGKVLEDGSVKKLDVKVGDRVLFGKYSGTEVKIEGEERLIVREDDILAVLEK